MIFLAGCDKETFIELIETLWNVNSKVFDEQVGQNIELIETLWNVNKTSSRRSFLLIVN